MVNTRKIVSALLLVLVAGGCLPARQTPISDAVQVVETSTEEPTATVTSAPLPTTTPVPVTEVLPTLTFTPAPSVRILAVNGNLYIRRGPGTAYNTVGYLMNSVSADVIGQDMLSKWVQVIIPDSEQSGWISLQTPYSHIDGDLSDVPAFTFTEWAEASYVKNCTEHDLLIMPNEIYLYSLWTNSTYKNQSQIDPGRYEIFDVSLPDEPLVDVLDIREGQMIYLTKNGLEEEHNCPENN
ncbi:MAG: SH3 domain-containing protein [Anaerolineales bacterium]|uniref:hypothetical protein n=1 Tax=Candidatus Villigracilis vicinus TaxID=3140679 RepID=UPI0031353821|nr:SH3 domain-containing protein [Anaerolineales bacterium]